MIIFVDCVIYVVEKDVYCIDCYIFIFVGEDILYLDLDFLFVESGINVYLE